MCFCSVFGKKEQQILAYKCKLCAFNWHVKMPARNAMPDGVSMSRGLEDVCTP